MPILLPSVYVHAMDRQLKSKYLAWLDNHDIDYKNDADMNFGRYKIEYADIDGNGIDDMVCSSYYREHVILTYDKKKDEVVKLINMDCGKGGFAYYNKKKHTISVSNSSTGHETMIIYKIMGTKLKKLKVFKALRGDIEKNGTYIHVWKYRIDGKKVSNEQYDKQHKAVLKGYKKVTPM